MKINSGLTVNTKSGAAQGRGRAASHFGEILQGAFQIDGEVRYALVTLPLGVLSSRAIFELHKKGGSAIKISPSGGTQGDLTKVIRAAEASLSRWAEDGVGGKLSVSGGVPRARGMGSSTSEAVAVVRAVAESLGVRPSAEEVARILCRSESASDPLMLDLRSRTVLFDQRRCEVLAEVGGTLPAFEVIGVDTGGDAVPTEDLGLPEYTASEISRFDELLISLKESVKKGDVRMLARVATESAKINQPHLPKPGFENFVRLAEECGSLGVSVAHSGTVMGMIFPVSEKESSERRAGETARRLGDLGHQVLRFRVPPGKF